MNKLQKLHVQESLFVFCVVCFFFLNEAKKQISPTIMKTTIRPRKHLILQLVKIRPLIATIMLEEKRSGDNNLWHFAP